MVSRHLLTIFVLSALLFLFISQSQSLADDDVAKIEHRNSTKPKKVTLSIYYEALCPACGNLIVNRLFKLFTTDLYTIVNLRMVPWGNAEKVGNENGTILCQYGPSECYLNIIQACAVNVWRPRKHLNFIRCVENQASSTLVTEATWRRCCDDLGLSQEPIDHCYRSGEGTKLVLRNGDETAQLQPPITYVPWVTVNGRALQEDYNNYVDYVCKAYRGRKPYACRSSYWQTSTMKKTPSNEVCYAETKKVSWSSENNNTSDNQRTKMEPQA